MADTSMRLAPVAVASMSPGEGGAGWWSRPHLVVMAIVFVGALAAGWWLLPGDDERVAALERDGRTYDALQLLETRFQKGDRSQRTLFQLQSLYEHFGQLDKARETLEMLASQRPSDTLVQRRLALLYRQVQNVAGYTAALERQLAVRYAEPACKELIGIYRGKGEHAAEQRTILSCTKQGYRRSDDVVRLAYLTAADGDLTQASALLRSVDDRRRLRVDRDRTMLFTALLETGSAEEAQKRAARWLKGSKDHVLVLQLIDSLAHQGRYDLAIDLAREVGTPGDSVALAVAELMLDRDQTLAASVYLKGWLDAARVRDPDIAHRFINAALDAEDATLAFRGAEKFGLRRIGQDELTALAEALNALGLMAEFAKVREALTTETVSANPLLAAAIEVERSAPEAARQLLSQVPADGLDEWRLALWAKLMETTGQKTETTQSLRLDIPAQAAEASGTPPQPAPAATAPVAAPPVAAALPKRPVVGTVYQPPKIVRRYRNVKDQRVPRVSRYRQQQKAVPWYQAFPKQKAKQPADD